MKNEVKSTITPMTAEEVRAVSGGAGMIRSF